jgi:TolB protein
MRLALATRLAVFAIALAAVLLTARAASSLPSNGKIAFSIENEVWVMNADGSNPVNFTDGQAGSGFLGGDEAAWSPDGTKILYSTQDTVYSEAIYWRSADGGVAHKVVDNRTVFNSLSLNRNPTWSGDGTKIAFTSLLLPTATGQYDIFSINLDETGLENLTENAAHDLNPAWSHDGTKIAFMSNRTDGFFDIWVMDADGSNPTQLTTGGGHDQWPRWSPDDSQIVFSSFRDSDDEIYTMNADGSNQVRVTSSPGTDAYPNWSPDGTKIVFMSNRGGQDIRHLFTMNPDGSDQTQISDIANTSKPAWQPVGEAPPPPPAPGTIRIFLDANPDGPQDFPFTGSGAIGNFDLDDDSEPTLPSMQSFTGLTAGSYTVRQIIPNTWTVVGLTCSDPDGGSSVDVPSATATIDLDAGETVECQYLDVPATGTIRIELDAIPDDPQDFIWTQNGPEVGFYTLDDDADPLLASFDERPDQSVGSYQISTNFPPSGWDLTAVNCTDPDGGSSVNLATGLASIDLDGGELVTCRYTYTKDTVPPTLTLPPNISVNATGPAGATVAYSATASDGVDPTPTLSCLPASGSLFPIGTRTVNCTATDDAGNSASGSFTVTVHGAGAQITALSTKTAAFVDGAVLRNALRAILRTASDAVAAGRRPVACVALTAYIVAVRLAPASQLTASEKAELVADATRIRAVIGC